MKCDGARETVDATFSSVYQEKTVSIVEQFGGGQNFGEQKVRDNRDETEQGRIHSTRCA